MQAKIHTDRAGTYDRHRGIKHDDSYAIARSGRSKRQFAISQ
jgi:hypothetical protein